MRWDDEATKTWMHITTSRSIPIDIPDLESPISPLHGHLASGSFGGSGRKNHPRALDKARLYEHAPLGRAGVAGWICCATCGAVNFRFSDRHHTSGNHGDDWPRAPVRGRARTQPTQPWQPKCGPELTMTGPRPLPRKGFPAFFPLSVQPHNGITLPVSGISCWLYGDSGSRARI